VARTVTVYRPDGSARILQQSDLLEGEDVQQAFTLPLSEIFG
jgi:Uma2 family endonuclease